MTVRTALAPIFALLLPLAAGCTDKGKQSAELATTNVQSLLTIANEDVAQIERGLPAGAAKLAGHLKGESDLRQNSDAIRTALQKIRREVPDLGIAKSTFFAVTDEHGVALRNDVDPDTMAGKTLIGPYPALGEVLDGKKPYLATIGHFVPPKPDHPEAEWIAATPVKREDGSTLGLLVTGWGHRAFAYHLQETLKRDLQEKLLKSGDVNRLPVIYVCVFDASDVYCARGTPAVDEQALKEAGLADRTANGPASHAQTITDRPFGWAAARVPKLGDSIGIVVLRSEV